MLEMLHRNSQIKTRKQDETTRDHSQHRTLTQCELVTPSPDLSVGGLYTDLQQKWLLSYQLIVTRFSHCFIIDLYLYAEASSAMDKGLVILM